MPAPSASTRKDIHAEITAQLIAAIEADPGRPVMPWRRHASPLFMPENALTKKLYNGINIVSLWVAAELRGYSAPIWGTYRQWQELDCQVRKGEKSSLVIFYKEYDAQPDADDENDDGKRRVARASYVFNASQVDGFTPPSQPEPLGPIERIENADRFFAATRARIEHGGDRAFYRPSTDTIHMPDESLFFGTNTMTRTEGYFATLGHEIIHWAGSSIRLNHDTGKRFGDAQYAASELIAEIGSAFLCAELGITQGEPKIDHAQYLAQWLTLLKNDSRAIFTAAAKASEAVAYLRSLQPPA